MILANQVNDYLIVGIIILIIIATILLIYFILKSKKKIEAPISPNFENRVEPSSPQVESKEETIINEEDAKIDSNIATLLDKMQKDLEASKVSYEEALNRYEDLEEENAIISYKELMKLKEAKESGIKNLVLEEKNKDEIKEVIKEPEVISLNEEGKNEVPSEIKKFKRSEFISPIFGLNEGSNVTYREIKRPPKKEAKPRVASNLEEELFEFSKEETKTDKNEQFFDALVDFRKKLD